MKKYLLARCVGWMIVFLMVYSGYAVAQGLPEAYRLTLNKIPDGQLPVGWSVAATHASGTLARWRVIVDTATPGREKVLTIDLLAPVEI